MPADFLMQQMMWREALEDAQGNKAAVDALSTEVGRVRESLLADLSRSLDVDKDYESARGQVRRLMFVEKLLKEIHCSGTDAPAAL